MDSGSEISTVGSFRQSPRRRPRKLPSVLFRAEFVMQLDAGDSDGCPGPVNSAPYLLEKMPIGPACEATMTTLPPQWQRDSRVRDSRFRDSRIRDSRIRDSRVRDSRVRDSRIRDSRVRDWRVRDSRVRAFKQTLVSVLEARRRPRRDRAVQQHASGGDHGWTEQTFRVSAPPKQAKAP